MNHSRALAPKKRDMPQANLSFRHSSGYVLALFVSNALRLGIEEVINFSILYLRFMTND